MQSFENICEKNAMKMKWVKNTDNAYNPDPNDQCYLDFTKRKFTTISNGTRYVYPLKIMYTVDVSTSSIHLAWDNHPMNFHKKNIYNGSIREYLERLISSEHKDFPDMVDSLLHMTLLMSHDKKGAVYNVYHEDIFYVLYLE